MECWKIKNNLIAFTPNGDNTFLDAKELYKINEKFTYNNNDYISPFLALNIRKSILGLKTILEIDYEDNNIVLNLYAIKKEQKYKVSINNNIFADYIIVDGVFHYLSTNYNSYMQIIENEHITANKKLSFMQYINLIKELNKQEYEYIDKVNPKDSLTKNEDIKFNAEGLNATLFNYQEKGCKWLEFMMNNKCGCILGDEMGLRKNITNNSCTWKNENK